MQVDFARWLVHTIGIEVTALKPSVIAGLEAAIVSAASNILKCDIASLLQAPASAPPAEAILLNGLLDCSEGPEEAAEQAVKLVKGGGFQCLKVKVMFFA